MKKIALLLVVVLCLACGLAKPAGAEELNIGNLIEKLPATKHGIAYSLVDHEWTYLSTVEVANYKGIGLELGFSDSDKIVGVASYELFKLADLGVTLPILDLIDCRVGLYGGYGRIDYERSGEGNNEFDYGLSCTLIEVKF